MKFVKIKKDQVKDIAKLEVSSGYKWSESLAKEIKTVQDRVKKGYLFFLIVEDKKKIGYISYKISGKLFYLSALYLVKNVQSRGLGKKVMKKLIIFAKKEGCKKFGLKVWGKNFPAISLYNKLGFYVTGIIKKHYKNGDNKLCMEKIL